MAPILPLGRSSRLTNKQKAILREDIITHPRELGYEFSN